MKTGILTKKNAPVLVIGLGRIGLPQALNLAISGFCVYGFDRNKSSIDALKNRKTPFFEPNMDDYLIKSLDKTFFPVSSLQDISTAAIDTIIFAVGTRPPTFQEIVNDQPLLLNEYYELLNQLYVHKILKKGIKIVIRTTMPLGGTDRVKTYLEEKFQFTEGNDFLLAFVPERIVEGKAIEEFKTIPIIIGTYSNDAFDHVSKLFQHSYTKIIQVKNPITAEFCKLTDNSYRNTVFSYANEIAMYANLFDIDVLEVINTVNYNYKRNHIPYPGFVSGYCLSKDPYIFEMGFLKRMKNRDFHSLWYYGRKTNDYLIEYVVSKVIAHIKKLQNSHVTILGLSFNADIDDFRMSHSFQIIEKLLAKGIDKLNVFDPNLEKNKYTRIPDELSKKIMIKSDKLENTLFSNVDSIIICDRHQCLIKANTIANLLKLLQNTYKPCYIFDSWAVWKEASKINHIIYESLGPKND